MVKPVAAGLIVTVNDMIGIPVEIERIDAPQRACN